MLRLLIIALAIGLLVWIFVRIFPKFRTALLRIGRNPVFRSFLFTAVYRLIRLFIFRR